LDKVV